MASTSSASATAEADSRAQKISAMIATCKVVLSILRRKKTMLENLFKAMWEGYVMNYDLPEDEELAINKMEELQSRFDPSIIEERMNSLIEEPERELERAIYDFGKVKAAKMSEEQIHALVADCKFLMQNAGLVRKKFDDLMETYG